jgi:flagellar basal body-associated protein FliL
MANEKPAPPAAEPAADAPRKSKAGLKMGIAAAAVLALEVATVVVTMKMAGGPRKATAEPPAPHKVEVVERDAEVKLVEARLPNSSGGRLFLYDLQVVAKVSEKNKTRVAELFAERDAEIRDQIRTIVASADPKTLAEPGLEILKRQIAYQLEQDLGKDGKDLLKEILIPKCTQIQVQF